MCDKKAQFCNGSKLPVVGFLPMAPVYQDARCELKSTLVISPLHLSRPGQARSGAPPGLAAVVHDYQQVVIENLGDRSAIARRNEAEVH